MPPRGRFAPVFIILVIALLILSCSRKTLSIFFDGVPPETDTTAQVAVNAIDTTNATFAANSSAAAEPGVTFHIPYKDKECGACHDQNRMGQFTLPQPDLCYQCHEDFTSLYSMLHAAVEGGSCTDCHGPHSSKNGKLLKMEEKSLCFTCHDSGDETWKGIHDGIDGAKCTECHNPHGGNESGFLK